MEAKVKFLVNWLQKKVKEANMNGLLVGVSGGLDSAVVANLIKLAFPNDALGVILPVQSVVSDQEDARETLEKINMDFIEIDLSSVHKKLLEQINKSLQEKSTFDANKVKMGDANLRARLRMSTLYTIANNFHYLVCGTDNEAEWYTGYFTKYGDGGVDINPLIHLKKSEVREMARYLNVPDRIVDKEPSAGLWTGQTDEAELGTSYDVIDRYLRGQPVPEESKQIIETLHKQTEHKRNIPATPPPFN